MNRKLHIVGSLILAGAVLAGYVVGLSQNEGSEEEQFYRGTYHLCVRFAEQFFFETPQVAEEGCVEVASALKYYDWYHRQSYEMWTWPLPEFKPAEPK